MKTIENLIQRVKENDDLALLLLFERYKPMIQQLLKDILFVIWMKMIGIKKL